MCSSNSAGPAALRKDMVRQRFMSGHFFTYSGIGGQEEKAGKEVRVGQNLGSYR